MPDTSDPMPTMRLRWVDKATSNVSVDMVLQQFWVYPTGHDKAGLWRDIPDAGHVLKAPTETFEQRTETVTSSITDHLRQCSPSIDTCQEAADIIEQTYGLLWRDTSFQGPATHAARKLLSGAISKNGQARGIRYAANIYGPVTEHEALKNFP